MDIPKVEIKTVRIRGTTLARLHALQKEFTLSMDQVVTLDQTIKFLLETYAHNNEYKNTVARQ